MLTKTDVQTYAFDGRYSKAVAYFSMEFAIDQCLKLYAGGLGFLAGSHMRSAFELKQNLTGVGLLWKYGYYDQARSRDGLMKPDFVAKSYSFLRDTGILLTVHVHHSPVYVRAFLLASEIFGTAPVFLLSTDIPENDELSRSITHYLYDSNETTRIAQSIILGVGGAMLLDALQMQPEIYHLNEGHALPLNFYLYAKYQSLPEVKKKVVFTTHTPEMAGNEQHNYALLEEMGLFYELNAVQVKALLTMESDMFSYTIAALKFAGRANAVSKTHQMVTRKMWGAITGICEISAITNAQNKTYWKDPVLDNAIFNNNDSVIIVRKKEMKQRLFKVIADQCGKLFNEDILTIVWARRFAGYKRADLLISDWRRFDALVGNKQFPVQIIWAGKPYPGDGEGIGLFNQIMSRVATLANCAVLTGYELALSGLLKRGADIWLNNPRMYHEASGTSGMTAAMNGAINLSMPDGWVPEFARDHENCFIIEPGQDNLPDHEKDMQECEHMMAKLEEKILPMYYLDQPQWLKILKRAASDVVCNFESSRLADEYYRIIYQ